MRMELPQLMERLGECRDLADYANLSLSLLGNPMVILDRDNRVLALSDVDTQSDSYEYLRAHRVPPSEYLSSEEWHSATHAMWQAEGVLRVDCLGEAHLSRVLRVGDTVVGRLDVGNVFQPFHEDDSAILELYSYPLSQYLFSAMVYALPKHSALTSYLEYLLGDPTSADSIIPPQISQLPWESGAALYLFCFNNFDLNDVTVLTRIFPQNALILQHQSHRIVLLPVKSPLSEEHQQAIRGHLRRLKLPCGMSSPFFSIAQIRPNYQHAYAALDLGIRVDRERFLYPYPIYSIYDLFRTHPDRQQLEQYLPPAMPDLIRADREQHLELLKTLRCYLYHDRSVRATADALHLHRNTVVYRINKALEILGENRNDGRFWLQLGTSIQILEFLDFRRYFV